MERAIEELRAAVERGQAEAVSQVTQAVERVLEERLLGHTDESVQRRGARRMSSSSLRRVRHRPSSTRRPASACAPYMPRRLPSRRSAASHAPRRRLARRSYIRPTVAPIRGLFTRFVLRLWIADCVSSSNARPAHAFTNRAACGCLAQRASAPDLVMEHRADSGELSLHYALESCVGYTRSYVIDLR